MSIKSIISITVVCGALAACTSGFSGFDGTRIIKSDATVDLGPQRHHSLSEMIAGIWVDGNGCEHWIIDDGIEGYMSTRWGPDGKPYCPSGNQPFTTKGFNRTRFFQSSMETAGIRNVPGEFTQQSGNGYQGGATPPHGGETPFINQTSGSTYYNQ